MRSDYSQARQQELAQKILYYSRRYITQRCSILLAPIYALQEEVSPIPGPMATDGVRLWYDPEQVIRDFQADRNGPARQLLHVTLHCLMGHLQARELQSEPGLFDAAADWRIAQLIRELDCGLEPEAPGWSLSWSRIPDRLPLAGLVRAGQEDKGLREALRQAVKEKGVTLDDHRRWRPPQRPDGAGGAVAQAAEASTPPPRRPDGVGGAAAQTAEASAPDWDRLRREMAGQARQGSTWGSLSGLLEAELDPGEDNGISYEQFLRRFASPNERLLLDPDSFDPRWYYLGLEQYGDIPLLEPSELSEPPVPDDIVIALDTSGSCSGEVCRRFLRETLSLLRDITAGAASFRILVLQCDTEIQQELMLESSDQLDRFLEDFTPAGFGGTDFRPVFDRVARRRAEGAMPRVKGLLYLSDGFGDFPEEAPDYPVTFLLLEDEDGWDTPRLPSWVSALYLNEHDFTLKEAQL